MPGVKRTISTPHNLSAGIQEIRKLAAKDTDTFIQNQLSVVNKSSKAVPFKYTWAQQQVAKIIKEEETERVPLRLYILKSRQVGLSTQVAARFFTKTWANNNMEAVIIAQQEIRAQELLARCKFFYTSMPDPLKLSLAQDAKAGLKYADTRGAMTIISAKNYAVARGGTKQLFQLSEFAQYTTNPITVLNEMEQLVDYKFGTEIIIETTGKGYDSPAHDFWRYCKMGKENYRSVFLAWQDDPDCSWSFISDRERDYCIGEALDYEPRLQDRMKHFKLTPGNTYYAYQILKNKCHGDWEFYLQEYPCDDDEAWRATGESFFGSENLNLIHTSDFPFEYKVFGGRSPIGQEFQSFDDLDTIDKLDENASRPFIKIWKRPLPHGMYVISADSAHGEEDGNFSSAFVIDMNTLEMMAEFHGRIRPDELAYLIASLGYIYNDAQLAPEYNQPGNVTLNELKRIAYPNIYRWRYIDDYKPTLSRKLGWQTNTASRSLMLALAKRIVADVARDKVLNKGIIKSRALVDEMRTFVVNELDGKPEAQGGSNDDRVMAWSIALIVASQETYGSSSDILSIYKTTASEPQATPVTDYQVDPMDVIHKLSQRKDQYYG